MRRLATLAAAVALLGAPAVAAALPLLPSADAEELAATLAEAEAVQGVCFSWYIEIEDSSGGGLSGIEAGSSRGGPGEWLTEVQRLREVRPAQRRDQVHVRELRVRGLGRASRSTATWASRCRPAA